MARNHFCVGIGYKEEMKLSSFNSLHHESPYGSDVVATLSDQFSSLSLLRPKPITIPPPPLSSSLLLLRAQNLSSENRIISKGPEADQFNELYLARLRENELQQDRAKVLQRQEARLEKRGLAHRNVSVLKESVGTGVFHPLQRPTSEHVAVVTPFKKRYRKIWYKSSVNEVMTTERREVMSTSQQQHQKQEECHYHLPSDMDFSKDWTF